MSAQTIPILPSPNFDATSNFYASLGFTERGRWDHEYLIVEHKSAGIELHFWYNERVKPEFNDVGCYIRFSSDDDAKRLYETWRTLDITAGEARGIPRLKPRDDDREFTLVDIHGNLLRLNS